LDAHRGTHVHDTSLTLKPQHTTRTHHHRRKITVPSELAFGKKGLPPFIPPDATVLFDVSIWSLKPAGVNPNLTLPGQQNYF